MRPHNYMKDQELFRHEMVTSSRSAGAHLCERVCTASGLGLKVSPAGPPGCGCRTYHRLSPHHGIQMPLSSHVTLLFRVAFQPRSPRLDGLVQVVFEVQLLTSISLTAIISRALKDRCLRLCCVHIWSMRLPSVTISKLLLKVKRLNQAAEKLSQLCSASRSTVKEFRNSYNKSSITQPCWTGYPWLRA